MKSPSIATGFVERRPGPLTNSPCREPDPGRTHPSRGRLLFLSGGSENDRVLEETLRGAGYRVERVIPGENPGSRLRDSSPDLILFSSPTWDQGENRFHLSRLSSTHGCPLVRLGSPQTEQPSSRAIVEPDRVLAEPIREQELLGSVRSLLGSDGTSWRVLFEDHPCPAVLVNRQGRLLEANQRAKTRWEEPRLAGQHLRDFLDLESQSSPENLSEDQRDVTRDGRRFRFEYVPAGPDTGILLGEDITREDALRDQLEASRGKQRRLQRELQDRVRNNLQLILSLINLQADEQSDPQAEREFTKLKERVHAIALVHKQLYGSRNINLLDSRTYLRQLARDLVGVHRSPADTTALRTELDSIPMDTTTTISFGLIMREGLGLLLDTSDGKHDITLSLRRSEDEIVLTLTDSGNLPRECGDFRNRLSFRLIKNIARHQLEGTVDVRTSQGELTLEVRCPAIPVEPSPEVD